MKKILLILFTLISFLSKAQFLDTTLVTYPYYVIHSANGDKFFSRKNVDMDTVSTQNAVSQFDVATYFKLGGTGSGLAWNDAASLDSATINSVISGLSGRPAIRILRGDTLSEPVTLLRNNVVWCSYSQDGGTLRKPVIYGKTELTEWELYSGSIYRAALPSGIHSTNQLFVDDEIVQLTRYPDVVDQVNDTWYYTVDAVTNDTVVTVSETSGINIEGAIANFRTVAWGIDSREIVAQSGSDLTFNRKPYLFGLATVYGLGINSPVFFTNVPSSIKAGSYYIKNDSIYVWLKDNSDPSIHQVKISTIEDGILCVDKSNVAINNLKIEGFNRTGIAVRTGGNNIKVSNCDLDYNYDFAIEAFRDTNILKEETYATKAYGVDVEHCTITGSNSGGVYIYGDSSKVIGTQVTDIGRLLNIGISGYPLQNQMAQNRLQGIKVYGNHNEAKRNTLRSIGYNPIVFNGLVNLIEYNVIDSFCSTLSDGGGIYNNLPSYGSIVRKNIIKNGGEQQPEDTGFGLYADGNQAGVLWTENSVENCQHGMLENILPECDSTIISHNKFINNRNVQLVSTIYENGDTAFTYHSIDHNTYGLFESTQYAFDINLRGDSVATHFYMDYDTLLTPLRGDPVYQVTSIPSFQAATGLESNIYVNGDLLTSITPIDTVGTEIFLNNTFDSNAANWYATWIASSPIGDGGALVWDFTSSTYLNKQSYNKTLNISEDDDSLYLSVKFDAIAVTTSATSLSLGFTGYKYSNITVTTGDVQHFQLYKQVTDTISNIRFDMGFQSTLGSYMYVDNAYLYLVHGQATVYSDFLKFYTNPYAHTIRQTLPTGTWRNIAGDDVGNYVDIPPFGAIALKKDQ